MLRFKHHGVCWGKIRASGDNIFAFLVVPWQSTGHGVLGLWLNSID